MPQPENPATRQPVTPATRDRWHRRTGRGTLRLFGPLFAPFLNRLQSRLRTAIEQSTVPPELRRIEAMLDDVLNSRSHVEHYPELGGTVVATLAAMRSALERMQAEFDRLGVRVDLLQVASDGLIVNQNEFHGSAAEGQLALHELSALLERVSAVQLDKLDRESAQLDAIRATQSEAPKLPAQLAGLQLQVDRQSAQLDAIHASQSDVPNVLAALQLQVDRQAAQLDAIRASQSDVPKLLAQVSALRLQVDRQHTLLIESRAGAFESGGLDRLLTAANAAQAVQTETLRMTGLLMSRSDSLLQRMALPLAQDTLVYTPDGYMLLPVEDPVLVSAVWESGGRLEPGTTEVIVALLREGDNAIDVGANVGLTVLPAARRVGPTGRVVAIEPGSRVAGLLRKTLELNFLADRVSLHHCAAGEAEGVASLNIGAILGHSSLLDLPHSKQQETVEVRTVDSLVPQGTSIRLVKLDVEGFEPRVWSGMRRIVTENPELAVLVEFGPEHLRRAGVSVEEWLAALMTPDFTAYEVAELTGHLRPLRAVASLADVSSLNLLLLRQPPTAFPELRFELA